MARHLVSSAAAVCMLACLGILPTAAAFQPEGNGQRDGSPAVGRSCSGEAIDVTDEGLRERLSSAKSITPTTPASVEFPAPGEKVSRLGLRVLDRHDQMIEVVLTCTLRCAGQECSLDGCDPNSWGCSSFDCTGEGCAGRCTGKSTE